MRISLPTTDHPAMTILFVHQHYPAQFGKLAAALVQRGDRVAVLHYRNDLVVYPGIESVPCERPAPGPAGLSPLAADFEGQVRAGEITAKRAIELKDGGFFPDVIIGHPGWGEMLFLRDVWPNAKIVAYPEFFFRPGQVDSYFDPQFGAPTDALAFKLRISNTMSLHALDTSDALWCPTDWQRACFPTSVQPRITVIHDGVDTTVAVPNPKATITLGREGKAEVLSPADEVITFVNRNHEPIRGFHIFMRALPAILARRPKARVVLIGGDGISYGTPPPGGGSWREFMLKELAGQLDLSRIHFVGKVPKEVFLAVLQLSTLHVYLTHPFVLSWSLLEAMSCGCRILASRTPPVTEFVSEGGNGVLFDFFRPDELAAKAIDILHHRGRYEGIRRAARETILERCDLRTVCLPAQMKMIDDLESGKLAHG